MFVVRIYDKFPPSFGTMNFLDALDYVESSMVATLRDISETYGISEGELFGKYMHRGSSSPVGAVGVKPVAPAVLPDVRPRPVIVPGYAPGPPPVDVVPAAPAAPAVAPGGRTKGRKAAPELHVTDQMRWTRDELKALTNNNLLRILTHHHMKISGGKDVRVDRIMEWQEQNPPPAEVVIDIPPSASEPSVKSPVIHAPESAPKVPSPPPKSDSPPSPAKPAAASVVSSVPSVSVMDIQSHVMGDCSYSCNMDEEM